MRVSVEIPDDLAPSLVAGQDPARAALEALALEAYRQHRLSAYQLRILLGFDSRWDLDGFLKEHKVYDYTVEDFEQDLAAVQKFRKKENTDSQA